MNFSFTFAKENVMKFEFNVETENDDEKIKKANANAHYVIWTREQYFFKLKISLRIYYTKINAKIKWTNSINSFFENNMHDNWIKDRFNVETFEFQIKNVKTIFEIIDFTKIAITIKTNCHNVSIIRFTLFDFFVENWIVMKIALIDLWKRNSNYELKINVRCENFVDSTLNAIVTTIVTFIVVNVQRFRQIKTIQFETITTIRNEQREKIDDYHAKLIKNYFCINDVCNNINEFCYKKSNDHYRLIFNSLKIWANAILNDRNDVFTNISSFIMFDHMKRYQNLVDTRSRTSFVAINKLDKKRKRQKKKKRRERDYQRRKNVQRRKKKSKIDEWLVKIVFVIKSLQKSSFENSIHLHKFLLNMFRKCIINFFFNMTIIHILCRRFRINFNRILKNFQFSWLIRFFKFLNNWFRKWFNKWFRYCFFKSLLNRLFSENLTQLKSMTKRKKSLKIIDVENFLKKSLQKIAFD